MSTLERSPAAPPTAPETPMTRDPGPARARATGDPQGEEELTVKLTRREISALVSDANERGLRPTSMLADAEGLQSAFKKLLAATTEARKGSL